MIDQLKKLGLTPGEAKIYVALVHLGTATVGPIVKDSNIAYSNVYDILDRLINKGLVSYTVKGKVKYFQMTSEHMFSEYLTQKQKELDEQKKIFKELTPLLKQTKSETKQEAEIFVGFKGITTAYEIMLSTAKKREEFLYLNVPRDEKVYKFYAQINWKFKEAGVILKGVADAALRNNKYMILNKTNLGRYVSFPLPGMVDIFQDKILIIDWTKPTGILITSHEIAEDYRSYFKKIWAIAKD